MKKTTLALSSISLVATPTIALVSCSKEEVIDYQAKSYTFESSHFAISRNEETNANIVNIELSALTEQETTTYKERIALFTKEFVDFVSPNIQDPTQRRMHGGGGMHKPGSNWKPGSGMGPSHGMSDIQKALRNYMSKSMRATFEINAHLLSYATELLANETFKTQIETAQVLQYNGNTIIDVSTIEGKNTVKGVLEDPDFDIAPLINDPLTGLTYNNVIRDRRISMLKRLGMSGQNWMHSNCGWNDEGYMKHYSRPNKKHRIDSSDKFMLVEIVGAQHEVTQELASSVAIIKELLW